jgi:hypothetical protein
MPALRAEADLAEAMAFRRLMTPRRTSGDLVLLESAEELVTGMPRRPAGAP